MRSRFTWLDHRALFFGVTMIAIYVIELTLIEVKYEIFRGGFLQSNVLESRTEIAGFLIVALLCDFLVLSLLWIALHRIFRRAGVNSFLLGYHFSAATLIVAGLVIGTRYQLQKYFSDYLDLAIITNLGGGNLQTALQYALGDIGLVIISIALASGGYYALHRLVKARAARITHRPWQLADVIGTGKRAIATILAVVLAMGGILYFARGEENVRVALTKKISYRLVSAAYTQLTDFDRDGVSWFGRATDPAPFNSAIYPGALDIPNNGIDEDGLFGDFRYRPDTTSLVVPALGKDADHLVVIVLESARADLLTIDIDGEAVAPNLRQIAAEGSLAPYAYSHVGYTGSSLKALFTGTIFNWRTEDSLFVMLKDAGYKVAVFSGQDETWSGLNKVLRTKESADVWFDAQTGVDERVFSSKLPSSIKLSEKVLFREFNKLAESTDWTQPHFIYLNFQASHFPYFHEGMRRRFVKTGIPRGEITPAQSTWLQRTYWNALAYADDYIGKVVESLKRQGVWEKTLLVVLGDHGESLFDDNFLGHGHFINDSQTQIPLVFSKPGISMPEPIGLSDIKSVILKVISGGSEDTPAAAKHRVFQFIGSIHKPPQIAIVEAGGKRTTIDIDRWLIRFSDGSDWVSLDTIIADSVNGIKAKELIDLWSRLRWENDQQNKQRTATTPSRT